DARGNLARIYGHGNAERWGWLHADLGGGDVLEVVAAAPRRRGALSLPPLPVARLRIDGQEWPRNPLAAAALGRVKLGLPEWRVSVRTRRHRLRVAVTIPAECAVSLLYTDPDGATATCTNSERASAQVTF